MGGTLVFPPIGRRYLLLLVRVFGNHRQIHHFPRAALFVNERGSALSDRLFVFERRHVSPRPVAVHLQIINFEDHLLIAA